MLRMSLAQSRGTYGFYLLGAISRRFVQESSGCRGLSFEIGRQVNSIVRYQSFHFTMM